MKKLVAALLAALLLGGNVAPVMAQNNPGQYNASNIGTPGFTLNASGSNWGQVFNVAGQSGTWALGAGSSQTQNGTTVLSWNSSSQVGVGTAVPQTSSAFEVGSTSALRVRGNGWLEFHQQTPPALSSCGSGNSVVSGGDQAGDVTAGAGMATCTLTFAEAPSNIPVCFAYNRTSKTALVAQPTATTLVIVGTGAGNYNLANDVISWGCIGWQ